MSEPAKKIEKAIEFPTNNTQITLTVDQLQALVARSVNQILDEKGFKDKKPSRHDTVTESAYKSNGVRKACKAEPIRDPADYKRICEYVLNHGEEQNRVRNYCLIVLGCTIGFRISDLLKFTTKDLFDNDGNPRSHVELIEKKTRKKNRALISDAAKKALEMWSKQYGVNKNDSKCILFGENEYVSMHESTAYRIITNACRNLGIEGNFGTHSLRKTYAYTAFNTAKENGNDGAVLDMLQTKFNHSSAQVTMRYACMEDDKVDEMASMVSEVLNE